MKRISPTRRQALAAYAALLAASPLSRAQKLAGEPPGRIPPVQELINAEEFEVVAGRKLDSLTFAEIAGSDRAAFDRITFRPRLMIDSRQMDLSTALLGETLFTPILIGPLSMQKRFHPEGELAMARGASAASALMVVADRSSYPIDQIVAQAKCPALVSGLPGAGHESGPNTRGARRPRRMQSALCDSERGDPRASHHCGHRLERDRSFAQTHRRAPCVEGCDEPR